MVKSIVGSPVTGENLVGRETNVSTIWSILLDSSVLITSPRRFGKTSIVQHMKESGKKGWKLYYLDVEAINTPTDFIIEVLDKLPQGMLDKFIGFMDSFKGSVSEITISQLTLKLRAELNENWQSKGNSVFEKIQEEEEKTVLILDELPTMLYNIMRSNEIGKDVVKNFLQWLRQLRHNKKIKFIICGSLGINQILRETDSMETINDYVLHEVGPLTLENGKKLLKGLLDNYKIKYTDDHITKILDLLGEPIPYFIQLIVQGIVQDDSNDALDIKIKKGYHNRIVKLEGANHFEYYYKRLDRLFINKKINFAIKEILKYLSVNNNVEFDILEKIFIQKVEDSDIALPNYLKILTDEFYLKRNDTQDQPSFSFHTKIMQDNWLQKYGRYKN